MKKVSTIILLILAINALPADEAGSFSEALDLAAILNKPILIDFWSDN
jgi:hypothetical protein